MFQRKKTFGAFKNSVCPLPLSPPIASTPIPPPSPMKLEALLEIPNAETPVGCRDRDWDRRGIAGVDIEAELAKRQSEVIEWINCLIPSLRIPPTASEEDLRARLFDGTVFSGILRRIRIDNCMSIIPNRLQYIREFISAVEKLGLPGFNVQDLEQGSISEVVYCLWSLKYHLLSNHGEDSDVHSSVKRTGEVRARWRDLQSGRPNVQDILRGDNVPDRQHSLHLVEERRHGFQDLRVADTIPNVHRFFDRIEERRHSFQDIRVPNTVVSEPSTPQSHHDEHKFHEVFQIKRGCYYDLPAAKISEMVKSNCLENAPTQSLLTIVNGILEESIEKKSGEVPPRVACLLSKVVREIERRIASQAEHIRNQNNHIKAREEKYQSRIRVLETLAAGASEEIQMISNQLQLLKAEKHKIEDRSKIGEENMARLMKEKEKNDKIISELEQNIETIGKINDEQIQQMETKTKGRQMVLEHKLKEVESFLEKTQTRIKELESVSESKFQNWNQREDVYQNFSVLQLQSIQELRLSSETIRHEVEMTQKKWCEELIILGKQLKVLTDAAENSHRILAENRKLYNEVQELKGNIRVYCRIRPFLTGENEKQNTIEYSGENGELLIENPLRQGKDVQRIFKFNKVFGQFSTQEEVFLDIRPLVRSVLDGFNVCIFAYGQTGSGKTHTMTGRNSANEEEWGVNYRALYDLFHISQNRRETCKYEVGIQMIEIYNEQVRDLLTTDGSLKKYPSNAQNLLYEFKDAEILILPSELLDDASMHPVKSTYDVLDLMQFGQNNRAVGATALNERSSRSHSIVTVHVRGVDLKTGATLRGSLHLVDLAGSERVDRSEVTGDRLKEAQHINKSLSALGDVIFSLSQKNAHVPYRNSKLTQVLQSSLGGHAKALMFVHINPDAASYSETLSTLKFAERVSGVELGAARCHKEGKDIRDLMEQIVSLKEVIAKKDEEIAQLQQLRGTRSRHNTNLSRHSFSSPCGISMLGETIHQEWKSPNGTEAVACSKVVSDGENGFEKNGHQSESGSRQSTDDAVHRKGSRSQSKCDGVANQCSNNTDLAILGDSDSEERLSDISDGILSYGTETDCSISSLAEPDVSPEKSQSPEIMQEKVPKTLSRVGRPPSPKTRQASGSKTRLRKPMKAQSAKSPNQATASSPKPPKRWQ